MEKQINRKEKQFILKKADEVVPLDGGWGWMCVIGCTLMHFLQGGFARSYGVVYIKVRERFLSSAAVTSWIGGMAVSVRQITCPIATILSNQYSTRLVCTTGGLLLGMSVMLSAMAPSIEFFFFTNAILTGFAGALVYAPAIVIVGQYFDKRRSLALGISTAGSGLGVLGFAPIVELLFEHYGYFGGLLITGAIMMNACISGSLYRPLPKRMRQVDEDLSDEKDSPYFVRPKPLTEAEKCDGMGSNHTQNDLQGYKLSEKNYNTLEEADKVEEEVSVWHTIHEYLRILRNKSFLIFILSMILVNCSVHLPIMLIPDHVKNQGLDKEVYVVILSAVGITNTVGRIMAGFLLDLAWLRPHRRYVYIVAALMVGLVNVGFAFSASMKEFISFGLLYGLAMAVLACQRVVVTADIVGIESLPDAVGVLMLTQGITLPPFSLVLGLIQDVSGTYHGSFLLIATCSIVAGVFLFLGYMIEKSSS